MTATVALVHILVITSARFRLEIEAMMLLPAAFGVLTIVSEIRSAHDSSVRQYTAATEAR